MKLFQVLLFVCVAVCYIKAEEELTKETIENHLAECKKELDATDQEEVDVFEHKPAKDQKEKCVRACVMKKMGVLDDKNHLVKERVTEVIEQLSKNHEEIKKMGDAFLEACADIEVPEDQCEAAEAYNLCMIEHVKEVKESSD